MICRYWRGGSVLFFFFFFNDTATTEIYTLSLHDALPISAPRGCRASRTRYRPRSSRSGARPWRRCGSRDMAARSEEHTSELQSQSNLVCRLLLEKKKKTNDITENANLHNTHSRPGVPTHA